MKNIETENVPLIRIHRKVIKIDWITKKISDYLEKEWCKTKATDELEWILENHLPVNIQEQTRPLIEEIRWKVKDYINLLLDNSDELKESIELLSEKVSDINKEKDKVLEQYNKVLSEQDKLINENEVLNVIANTDVLTWLRNPRSLELEITNLIERYHQKQVLTWVSIAILDIDDFKKINDIYWHWNWDNILKNLALILEKYFWKDNFSVFRKWWEEFVILSEVDYSIFIKRLEKFFNVLKGIEIKRDSSNKIPISFSWATVHTKKLEFWDRQPENWKMFNKKELYEIIVATLGQWLIEAKAIPWKGSIIEK
jgi:diguanylate cyclase (GGDEF)-like protein